MGDAGTFHCNKSVIRSSFGFHGDETPVSFLCTNKIEKHEKISYPSVGCMVFMFFY